MKAIINGYDMDSGIDAWARKFGNPKGLTLKGWAILVQGRRYKLETYRNAQQQGTKWMAERSARMGELVRQRMTREEREGSPRKKKKDPNLRVKSYLLQEAEGVSRAAKVAWCEQHDVRVVNMQHDGIMVSWLPDGLTIEEVAEQMSMAASAACGYEVLVEGKAVGPERVD